MDELESAIQDLRPDTSSLAEQDAAAMKEAIMGSTDQKTKRRWGRSAGLGKSIPAVAAAAAAVALAAGITVWGLGSGDPAPSPRATTPISPPVVAEPSEKSEPVEAPEAAETPIARASGEAYGITFLVRAPEGDPGQRGIVKVTTTETSGDHRIVRRSWRAPDGSGLENHLVATTAAETICGVGADACDSAGGTELFLPGSVAGYGGSGVGTTSTQELYELTDDLEALEKALLSANADAFTSLDDEVLVLLMTALDVFSRDDFSGALRAAVFEILADLPGAEVATLTSDMGEALVGLKVPSDAVANGERTMLFDQASGRLVMSADGVVQTYADFVDGPRVFVNRWERSMEYVQ